MLAKRDTLEIPATCQARARATHVFARQACCASVSSDEFLALRVCVCVCVCLPVCTRLSEREGLSLVICSQTHTEQRVRGLNVNYS